MRYLLIFVVMLGSVLAGEPGYPLWDGSESVADYAKRVNLPPTKTIDLGGGVKMELVLIPAGNFVMGTPEPTPLDEDGFRNKIITGQAFLATSGVALLVMLVVVIVGVVKKKRRPQVSLAWLLLVTATAGGCLLSGLHWQQSARGLVDAKVKYEATKAGYNAAGDDEKPAHSVTLTKPYYIGKCVVTQEQYQLVTGTNPSQFKGKYNPVETVSWDEAQAFIKKLSELTRLAVRLPTEAEWEYSCRAGTKTNYFSGDTDADLASVGWYVENSNNTTHPVGQKVPNTFGLYDMHGNVWQWCEDWYVEDYYGKSEAENPQGPEHGTYNYHALRGGSWGLNSTSCRSACRFRYGSDDSNYFIGFRVVMPMAR